MYLVRLDLDRFASVVAPSIVQGANDHELSLWIRVGYVEQAPVFIATRREHMDGRDQHAIAVVVTGFGLPEAYQVGLYRRLGLRRVELNATVSQAISTATADWRCH